MSALRRLYRGETNINFIGNRKKWYIASAIIILVCVGSMVFRGFHWGVEFAGGTQFVVAVQPGTSEPGVSDAIQSAGGPPSYLLRTPKLSNERREAALAAIVRSAKVNEDQIAVSEVSSSWGRAV